MKSIEEHHTHYKSGWKYKGYFKRFYSDEGTSFENIPCTLYYYKNRPIGKKQYYFKGTLKEAHKRRYIFKPSKLIASNGFSFAEKRYQIKRKWHTWLKNYYSSDTSDFLFALTMGNSPSKFLTHSFLQIGIIPILVISGMHFGIISAFLFFLCRFIFPYRKSLYAVFVLISLYFLLLGPTPSIVRAYVLTLLYLFSEIKGLKTHSLNLLGTCALVEMIITPQIPADIGFSLSFLSCLSILLFYPTTQLFMKKMVFMTDKAPTTLLHKQIRIVSLYFQKTISLTLSVNVLLLPFLLYQFGKFPISSLIVNLFYPSLVFFLIVFFLASLPITPFIFSFIELYSECLLKMVYFFPASLQVFIYTPSIPLGIIIFWIFSICFLGVYLQRKEISLSRGNSIFSLEKDSFNG